MKKILIDTNIIIDLLAKRENYYQEASKLFSLADQEKLQLLITSLTLANTHYILSKHLDSSKAKEILRRFKVLVEIIPVTDKVIDLALSDEAFKDFEDGLQYYSAIENGIALILSRNKKDFKNSKLPVLTAKEFLTELGG